MRISKQASKLLALSLGLLISLSAAPARAAVVLFEDFQPPPGAAQSVPAGWTVINVDGRTPAMQVSYINEAWKRVNHFNDASQGVAASTSDYSPPGAADDWLITPAIALTTANTLSWVGQATDNSFRDGYEVRISTTGTAVANFTANAALFSVAEENSSRTARSINLEAAGYTNRTVYIAFRNVSNNKFLLYIDDVKVERVLAFDAGITGTQHAIGEYTRVPLLQGYALVGSASVKNFGVNTLTNLVLQGNILKDGVLVATRSSATLASLAPGVSSTLTLGSFTPTEAGEYVIEYSVSSAETDGDLTNNTAIGPTATISSAEMARDNGVQTGFMRLGVGLSGEYGQTFRLLQPGSLTGVRFFLIGRDQTVGDSLTFNVRRLNHPSVPGAPFTILGTTVPYTIPDNVSRWVDVGITSGGILLPAGDFFIGLVSADGEQTLGTSTEIFTAGTTWAFGPGQPTQHLEDAGLSVALMLRAQITPPRTLTVSKTGAGMGTVTATGIDCGPDCNETYADGVSVTVTANAASGFYFVGFSGDCTGMSCVLTMDTDKAVTATFGFPTLTVSKGGSTGTGTVTSNPAGIDCGADCAATFSLGAVVTLTAAPAANTDFAGFSGGGCSTSPCDVTMDATKTVTATFTIQQRALMLATNGGTGGGSLLCNGVACAASYAHGTVVTIAATPNANSDFAGFSGGGCSTSPCDVTMDAAKTVTATFTLKQRTLSVTPAGSGSGTVTSDPSGINCTTAPVGCSATFADGTLVTLTFTPAANSDFGGFTGDCTGGPSTCTVTMDAAKFVTATFTVAQRALAVTPAGSGSGSVTGTGISCPGDCGESYVHGTSVTLTATPDVTSDFAGWSGACSGTGSCVVTMDAAKSVTATFTLKQRALTVATSGTGTGSVTATGINCPGDCAESYTNGTAVTLSAAAATNSEFAGWSGACSDSGSCVVTMDAAKSVMATFTSKPTSATVDGSNGKPVSISTSSGSIANAMLLGATPSGAPADFRYPNGFFSFDITGLAPGGTAVVTLTLPAGSAPTDYVKCNTAGTVCAQFAGAAIAGDVVTLTLVDGGAGDSDGAANGTIKDPGAPAVFGGGDGGAFSARDVLVLLALMIGGGALRRRKTRNTAPA